MVRSAHANETEILLWSVRKRPYLIRSSFITSTLRTRCRDQRSNRAVDEVTPLRDNKNALTFGEIGRKVMSTRILGDGLAREACSLQCRFACGLGLPPALLSDCRKTCADCRASLHPCFFVRRIASSLNFAPASSGTSRYICSCSGSHSSFSCGLPFGRYGIAPENLSQLVFEGIDLFLDFGGSP